MNQLPEPPSVYQLRIVLREISPLIWRRLLVCSDTTLAHLHTILQIVFTWSGEHLHTFHIHGKDYGSDGADTRRLADQAFNARPQGQMFALDFLRVPFAWAMHFRVQMPGICHPMIGIKAGEPKGLEQRFQLQKNLILATSKDIRQDRTRVVINRMPQPPLVLLLADKTPHLIYLGFPSSLNRYGHLLGVYGTKQSRVDRLKRSFFLFEFAHNTVSVLIRSTRAVSRIPLALTLMSMIVCFTSGKQPRLR